MLQQFDVPNVARDQGCAACAKLLIPIVPTLQVDDGDFGPKIEEETRYSVPNLVLLLLDQCAIQHQLALCIPNGPPEC